MSLPFQASQTTIEAGISVLSNPIPTPLFKFFGSTFLERKVEKIHYFN